MSRSAAAGHYGNHSLQLSPCACTTFKHWTLSRCSHQAPQPALLFDVFREQANGGEELEEEEQQQRDDQVKQVGSVFTPGCREVDHPVAVSQNPDKGLRLKFLSP